MHNQRNLTHNTFINSYHLKVIAMTSMLIDHIGAFILLPLINQSLNMTHREQWIIVYQLSRSIGRLAMPIFCFLIVEGFVHTRNLPRYARRLGLLALLSEIPYDLAHGSWFDLTQQNVLFTLLAGLLAIWALRHFGSNLYSLVIIGGLCLLVIFLGTDYSYRGIIVICLLYAFREWRFYQSIAASLAFLHSPFAIPAFALTYFYNGEKGQQQSRYFYAFYPVHLLLYALIAHYLLQQGG